MERQHKLMIRLSATEKAFLEERAEEEGLKLASWARRELIKSAKSYGAALLSEESPGYGAECTKADHGLLSLFCGPGGLDEGFRQAGFHTTIASDIDADCMRTFEFNHPGAHCLKADVRQLTPRILDDLVGEEFRPVGVIGGPPCQSFSVSNVHQKDDDPRHNLALAYAKLLKDLNKRNPISFFLFENVPGLLGKRHRERYLQFKKEFQLAGFKVYEAVLDAKDFGIPQERPRIFIVGINEQLHPQAHWSPPKPTGEIKTVRDTISDLPEPVFNERGLDPDTFPVHPNHWCLVPKSAKFQKANLKEGQMFGRSFRTLRWDAPSWTVAYGHREVHVHPKGHRRLSIYEAMLLQSFSKDYRLVGNMTAQVRLVSEAVPPLMGFYLANSIIGSIGDANLTEGKRLGAASKNGRRRAEQMSMV